MNIETIKVKWAENELSQNTYIVEFEDGCIVIDAGCSLELIQNNINKPIKAVFITHGHYDHILCIEEYSNKDIPIYANKNIEILLQDITNNASNIFNSPQTFNINNINYVEDGQKIEIGKHIIKCVYTPGHSTDSMCFILDNIHLFSGDTVFSVAVGRDDLPTGNTKQLINSLNKLLNLDYKYLYTGHGRPSTKDEQQTNIPKWLDYLSRKEKQIWEK